MMMLMRSEMRLVRRCLMVMALGTKVEDGVTMLREVRDCPLRPALA